MIAKGGGKQTEPVPAFPINLIRFFEHSHTGSFEVPGIGGDVFFLSYGFQPIVQPAYHDGADRAHGGDIFPFAFPAFKAAFNCFSNGDRLGQSETYRGVDANALVGGFFDCRDAGAGNRNLYKTVKWGQVTEALVLPLGPG